MDSQTNKSVCMVGNRDHEVHNSEMGKLNLLLRFQNVLQIFPSFYFNLFLDENRREFCKYISVKRIKIKRKYRGKKLRREKAHAVQCKHTNEKLKKRKEMIKGRIKKCLIGKASKHGYFTL